MSKLDKAKERIAYEKFWLGVMVVTDVSLVGWLVSAPGSSPPWYRVVAAVLAVAVITSSGFIVHRRIEKQIDVLEDL
ncbi:MAG: hypothetical protein HY270_07875 [Deltaproteobacteria bacterium]|nr:hypothetical protein [Deltaproteobacteria bacterium]